MKCKAVQDLFLQSLIENDHALLKTVIANTKYSRGLYLQEIFKAKSELGGFTPLQYVCFQGNSSTASMLINTGNIDVNEKGAYDWTALHAAVYSGDFGTVQILLNSCADCFAKDIRGKFPISYSNNETIHATLKSYMKTKNLKLFEELSAEIDQFKMKKKCDRTKSCFARIADMTKIFGDFNNTESSSLVDLRKWRTCANLSEITEI